MELCENVMDDVFAELVILFVCTVDEGEGWDEEMDLLMDGDDVQ